MVNAVGALSSVFSFTSLILVAIAIGTNFWVRIEDPRLPGSTEANPLVENEAFRIFNKISCAYIGSSCYSNVCWIRNGDEERCRDARVQAIENCSAYQAARAMTIIGTIFLVVGASLQAVSIFRASRSIALIGAVLVFLAFFFLMIAFGVFHRNVFVNGQLDDIGNISWSFVLFIIAWPLAFLASLLGFMASLNAEKGDADFEESAE